MFEYKFFTGNTAPKYVEGDYLLTVKGNMMEMKKVGEANTVKVSSVCKDGDTWSLQGGIENCLSKVPENTKINVGDTVKFKNDMNHFFSWRETAEMRDFIEKENMLMKYVLSAVETERSIKNLETFKYVRDMSFVVLYIDSRFAYIYEGQTGYGLFVETKDIKHA